eukprot:TRINITY_DN5156_c0_g1_i1.p1 TRINITY_DN5156_c0_g1~~TRINITY_DN5156_c0_g1_i1.p1  ORF type:complete len:972 (+),score=312.76 TRINITY_DN5156_c0_g1_i1:230-3145(+)
MWIKPEIHKGGLGMWATVQSNEYFEILKRRIGFSLSMKSIPNPFRLIIKSEPSQVVAEAATQESIQTDLDAATKMLGDAIMENPTLSKLSSEELINYLLVRFQCMTVELPDSEQKKMREEAEQRMKAESATEENFQSIFGLKGEKLVSSYTCSVWERVPKAGILYCSHNYVCFYSALSGRSIKTPFVEIKSIVKESYNGVQTIKIEANKEEYWLVSFKLQEILTLLHQLWDISLNRVLKSAEKNLEEIEAAYVSGKNLVSTNLESPTSPSRVLATGAGGPLPLRMDSKASLGQIKRDQTLQARFRLPVDETLSKQINNVKILRGKSFRKGTLFVSKNFLCFESQIYGNAKFFSFVIPFQDIDFFALGGTDPNLTGTQSQEPLKPSEIIQIHCAIEEYFIQIANNQRDSLYEELQQNLREVLNTQNRQFMVSPITVWNVSIVPKLPESFIQNRREFAPLYKERDSLKLDGWSRFCAKNGNGITMVKNQKLKSLIRAGIPDDIRGRMWMILSGAYSLLLTKGTDYYSSMIRKCDDSLFKEDIEKDLHRSFPEHPHFQTDEGLNDLRQVLIAFSVHNPTIGYCQSMNIVAALLLLYLPPEHAFYLLCTICEQLVPDYYVKAMIGSIVDQKLFEELMKNRLGAVAKHLESTGLPLPLVTLPWFMCIYIGYVPLEASLRILDCFFGMDGPAFLFSVGLALFQLNESSVIQEKDGTVVASLLRNSITDPEDLLPEAFKIAENLTPSLLNDLRNAHRAKAIKEMDTKSENTRLRELKKVVGFTPKEVTRLYNEFSASTGSEHNANFAKFEELFGQHCPGWAEQNELDLAILFKLLDKQRSGTIDVMDYIATLSIILLGTEEERVSLSFRLFDGDCDGFISKDEYEYAVGLLKGWYAKFDDNPSREKQPEIKESLDDLISFDDTSPSNSSSSYSQGNPVSVSFKESDLDGDNRLDWQEYRRALMHPLFNGMLSLKLDSK